MQYTIKCKSCNHENPLYQLTCRNCNAFLRERIFNIDLWEVLMMLIETPSRAYTRIIHAEHKNFIIFILFFAAIKLSINSVYISLALSGHNFNFRGSVAIFLINLVILVISVLLSSLIYTYFTKSINIKTRFRDNISVTTYSFMPYIFALVLLFPIELILFGYTVFSVNPSPFIIKESLAYIMLGFELLFITWSMFLAFMAFRRQTGGVIVPLGFMLLLNVFIYLALYLTAELLLIYEV